MDRKGRFAFRVVNGGRDSDSQTERPAHVPALREETYREDQDSISIGVPDSLVDYFNRIRSPLRNLSAIYSTKTASLPVPGSDGKGVHYISQNIPTLETPEELLDWVQSTFDGVYAMILNRYENYSPWTLRVDVSEKLMEALGLDERVFRVENENFAEMIIDAKERVLSTIVTLIPTHVAEEV